jgi:hypothetical protein
MEPRKTLPILLAAAALVVACAPLASQQAVEDSPANPYKATKITTRRPPMPFPPGSEVPGPVKPIEFRSPDRMTEKDRDVEADGESSIRERVSFAGLEFNEGKWSYQQIVCPAFPNHVLLKFTRNNGKGDESVFTASIPRMGEGRVRIIPILRRGYSLFSPAPVNALTISAFNHIRAEEHASRPPDWLSTGMCYAALAGAHPQVALGPESTESKKFTTGVPAILQIPAEGGAVISFLDVAARPQPMQWAMTFDKKGKLLKATHTPTFTTAPTAVPPTLENVQGTPVPPTLLEVTGTTRP